MKMKSCLGLLSILGLVISGLVSPAVIAEQVDFNAGGHVTYISAGLVSPAGNSGRFVVEEREIKGTFTSGDLTGDFSVIFKANVELETQSGQLGGTLTAGSAEMRVNGSVQPLEFVEVWPGVWLPKLVITGNWTFTSGEQGTGDFVAWAIFIPDPDGHVEYFLSSAFNLTGTWK